MSRQVPLSDVADIVGGFAFKSEDFDNSGFPVVRIADIHPPTVDLTNCTFISAEKVIGLDRFKLSDRDIVMAMTGATIGKVGRIRSLTPIYLNQRVAKISAKAGREYDNFVYAVVSQSGFDYEVLNRSAGSAQPNISATGIGSIPIPYFTPVDQLKIGSIIGSLDDKIELNRRMNETLEGMARAIFKSWFVDFDPVWAKKRGQKPVGMDSATAALFPNDFEDSKLGKIPKGWKVGKLEDIADNKRDGVLPEQMELGTPYIGLEHMPRKSIALAEWGNADNVESNKFKFVRNDILFGKLRPYFHKVGIAACDGVCSTDILTLVPKTEAWRGYLLMTVSSIDFVNYTDAGSGGTKMPRTNWEHMARYALALSPERLATRMNSLLNPMFEQAQINIHESRTLATLRDTLLPKLMSGEIRVKDAEKFVEGN